MRGIAYRRLAGAAAGLIVAINVAAPRGYAQEADTMSAHFSASIHGDLDGKVAGRALIAPPVDLHPGVAGFVLKLRGGGDGRPVLGFMRLMPGWPKPGRYPIADATSVLEFPKPRPVDAFVVTYIVGDGNPAVLVSEGGYVRITRSDAQSIEGTFSVRLKGNAVLSDRRDMKARAAGHFKARLAPPGDIAGGAGADESS